MFRRYLLRRLWWMANQYHRGMGETNLHKYHMKQTAT